MSLNKTENVDVGISWMKNIQNWLKSVCDVLFHDDVIDCSDDVMDIVQGVFKA